MNGTQIGQVVFSAGRYEEIVILKEGEVELILCVDRSEDKLNTLYRLSAPGTPIHNIAKYNSHDAINAYHDALNRVAVPFFLDLRVD